MKFIFSATTLICLLLSPVALHAAESAAMHFSVQSLLENETATPVRIKEGETARILWSSDTETEIHMHGYDIKLSILPDEETVLSFKADITGRFPVTLHQKSTAHHVDHAQGHEGEGHDHAQKHDKAPSLSLHNPDGHKTLLYIEVYPQ